MDVVVQEKQEEGRNRTIAELAIITTSYTDSFLKPEGEQLLPDDRQRKHWVKPGASLLKLNSDGAFDPVKKDGGWGFVIRDDQGRVIKPGAGRADFLLNALHAELLACYAGLQEAVKMGVQVCACFQVMTTDCLLWGV